MNLSVVRRTVGCTALTLLIAGCAHGPKPEAAKPATAPQTAPPANTTPPERQHYVLELLEAGKRDQARVEAQQLVKEQPANSEATTLLNEIDADPQVLLGAQSFTYTIQPGETLSTLADRFLGDSNLFYALARYNNIEVPSDAAPGATILIPSTKEGARTEHPEPKDHPPRPDHKDQAPPTLRRRPELAPEVRKGPVAPETAAPAAPVRDPARASGLRSQALVQLNKGDIDRAVSLLREASHLDPDSQPINADLARALRIQGATHK